MRTKELSEFFQSYWPYEHQLNKRQTVLVTEESHDKQYWVGHNDFYEQVSSDPHVAESEDSALNEWLLARYLTWHDYPSLVERESYGILLLFYNNCVQEPNNNIKRFELKIILVWSAISLNTILL